MATKFTLRSFNTRDLIHSSYKMSLKLIQIGLNTIFRLSRCRRIVIANNWQWCERHKAIVGVTL
jgi:hypothetical protein